jgi:N-acyl homoserine lactone hydrolase
MTIEAHLELLLSGNGINFQQGDLALSTIALVRSEGAHGQEVRTIIDTGHVGMRRNILEALVHHGLSAADIDFVCLTHVHWDHVQNLDLFANARIVLARAELESIQGDAARDLVTPAWTRFLIDGDRMIAVEPGDEIIPGIEIIDAAGHTQGSLAYAVRESGKVSVVTGDALPWAEVGRLQRSALVFWDLDRSQETIGRLTAMADIIYPGHDRPFTLNNGRVVYLSDYDMTMFGAGPSTKGLKFGSPPILTTIDLTDGEPVGPRWTKEELLP